ncbi:type II toxin-antitoxin system CcdA family antitoxin [Methanospirillum sp.]
MSGKRYAQCTVSIDADIRELARERKLNLSALLTRAIQSEISHDPECSS